jgi:hypothetical protein
MVVCVLALLAAVAAKVPEAFVVVLFPPLFRFV